MHHKLHFLDWQLSLADAVGAYLIEGLPGRPLNLNDTLIIVPTVQSGRRLRRALADRAALQDDGLLLGQVITPFRLLEAEGGLSRLAETAFWINGLTPSVCRRFQVLFPRLPADPDFEWRKKTAELFIALRVQLAEAGLTVADVAESDILADGERGRWRDIVGLVSHVVASIEHAGYRDGIGEQLRLSTEAPPPPGVRRVVLAACPELAPVLRNLLARWSTQISVEVLVHAPGSKADLFDTWGCPRPDRWLSGDVTEFGHGSVEIATAADEKEQAERTRRVLESHSDLVREGAVAIGVPDPAVAPYMVQTLSELGCPSYDPDGISHACHPVYLWLRAWRDLAAAGRYESLRNFLRHADVLTLVAARCRVDASLVLQELDEVQNQCLPEAIADVQAYVGERADGYPNLAPVLLWVRRQLDAAAGEDPAQIRSLLSDLYDSIALTPGNPGDDAFIDVARGLIDKLDAHAEVISRFPDLRVTEWLDLLLHDAADDAYYLEARENAIDLEGWLELPWSSAPLMIVTGMNDTVVPGGTYEDLFLPDSAREQLGIRASAARTARDAYLLHALSEARRATGRLVLIAGRQNGSGDVLKPSRLFWLCGDDRMIERAGLFFSAAQPLQRVPERRFGAGLNLVPPDDRARERIARRSWSVTEFRGYLACPFRFYLENVLEMAAADDRAEELDALDFGTLVHGALEQFGRDRKLWAARKPEVIGGALEDFIRQSILRRFGRNPPMMVQLQADAAVQRLWTYAHLHVKDFREGWEIIDVERRFTIDLDGVDVVGKIDRIDRHADGRFRVLDYKTYNKPADPEKSHLRAPRDDDARTYVAVEATSTRTTKSPKLVPRHWADLQLPLYLKHMLDTEGEDAPVTTGYVLLTKAATDVSIAVWDGLDRRLVRSAVGCARGIIADAVAGVFGPPLIDGGDDDFSNCLWPDFIHDVSGMTEGKLDA